MKITRRQLRKLIIEASHDARTIGDGALTRPASVGGTRPDIEYIVDDYIANPSQKAVFEQRVLDAMKKYTELHNRRRSYEPLNVQQILAGTQSALDMFELQTTGTVKDDHRFGPSRGRTLPIDSLGNITVQDLPDDMALASYERYLIEDNAKKLASLIFNQLKNLDTGIMANLEDFIYDALGLSHSAMGHSLYAVRN
jgi:hypothetical protein